MDRCLFGEGGNLLEDIGKLHVELILGRLADVRCAQDIGMRQKRVCRVNHRLSVEHVESPENPPLGNFRLKDTRRDQPGARRVHKQAAGRRRREIFGADDPARVQLEPRMQTDNIAGGKSCLTALAHTRAAGLGPRPPVL